MAVDHYENFPVASLLLPARLRPAVAAIYVFARSADDFADEGDLPAAERLRLLNDYRSELERIEQGATTDHPVFLRLRPHIEKHQLPLALFRDLLDAFAQDVVKTRYANFYELMDYCRRSANPVGRLLLHLFGAATPDNLRRSDAICSALQLVNHWQDVGVDASKPVPRIYLPQDDMARFNVTEESVLRRVTIADFRTLLRFQVDRARALMNSGARLGHDLPGRIGLEIRTIVAGGLRILDKIEAVDYDVFNRRPVLGAFDWPRILIGALRP
ncbi:MAG: squalene synthase HpnC [Gammaproteobacteria bacterium]|nr:squalene synthase HpnC [Rhodocyclaceae bacterium]MBU3908500.1 squalene synthase HpnC [Gammaproteobacteria bacterium]MBU3988617.1 squalene synthase HpnC [Gammaproteobacteria bacterium]MBU4004528.1 squalene synthase HpnC [Gammaproteobacteria bacterium]MBU4021131.1 squalene synthase HpnC [Gammaproteobacteria bacterium]